MSPEKINDFKMNEIIGRDSVLFAEDSYLFDAVEVSVPYERFDHQTSCLSRMRSLCPHIAQTFPA
jgi:phage-related protein